ncbi:MAG: flagellar export chaperone FlgN [Candidatus Krumholzibacteriia bacterium]
MPETRQAPIDTERQVMALEQALQDEGRRYERLYELALDQGRRMTGTDLDALAASAAALAEGLAEVEQVRARREQLAFGLMATTGERTLRLTAWLETQPAELRERLGHRVAAVRAAGQRLLRQNEKNRRLASFCLDLVEEEAQMLRRSVLHDPAGCYDRGAHPARDGGGHMLQKKA